MNRDEFERLRDLPDKRIVGDINLQRTKNTAPLLSCVVPIENSAGVNALVRIELNEQTDSKTLNVWIPDTGPICRLDVDARDHKEIGRSHKHSLKLPDCPHPSINLSRDIQSRADLAGMTIQEVFTDFCHKARITHEGSFNIS